MGMAASQVRFLSLQNRKNTIGLNLMTLSNRRTALSRDMKRVAAEYNNAMNQKKLQWSSDCGVTFKDINYDMLMKPSVENSTMPYIITDAQGRVVLDNKEIVLKNGGTGVSYVDLAKKISTYSGINEDGKAAYDNLNNVVTNSGMAISGGASDHEYEIISNIEGYGFENSMRYDLMKNLGLIEEEDIAHFNLVLDKLYGNKNAFEINNYSGILEQFDASRTAATEVNGDYSKVFGTLDFANFSFKDAEGNMTGSALGNLELAKAYQREYQAYLNTPIRRDILVNKDWKIATSSESPENFDSSNVTHCDGFKYDENADIGISNRMIGFLTATGVVNKDGEDYLIKTSGLLQSLPTFDIKAMDDNINLRWTKNNIGDKGRFSEVTNSGDLTAPVSWAWLYDTDAGMGDTAGAVDNKNNSYDTDNDGYIKGSDYINNNQNKQTGVSLQDSSEYDKRTWDRYNDATHLYTTIEEFANAMYQDPYTDNNAVKFAERKTKELYKVNYEKYGVEHEDGPHDKGASRAAAAGAADSGFVFGYDQIAGHADAVAFNVTNMINAFITFYEMYLAVNGDESRIQSAETGQKAFNSDFNNYAKYYDNKLAEELQRNSNVIKSIFSDYKSDGYSLVGSAPAANLSTEQTVSFEKTDEEDGTIIKMNVTGIWNGYDFTKISNIDLLNSSNKKIESYSSRTSTGSADLNHTYYDDNGNKILTVEYSANSTNTSATINLNSETNISGKNVKKIQINNGTVSNVYNASGTAQDLSAFQANVLAYYIVDESNTAAGAKDPNYKYYLEMGDDGAINSVFASSITGKPKDDYSEKFDKLVADCEAEVKSLKDDLENCFASYEGRMMNYFDALFKYISKHGWVYDENINGGSSSGQKQQDANNYLTTKLQNNMLFITEVDTLDGTDFAYSSKLASSVTQIFEMFDQDANNAALSRYESEKTEIQSKEKQLDIRINKLETEQDAIKTEMDSLKTIINDNVQNTFKIFS